MRKPEPKKIYPTFSQDHPFFLKLSVIESLQDSLINLLIDWIVSNSKQGVFRNMLNFDDDDDEVMTCKSPTICSAGILIAVIIFLCLVIFL